MGKINHLATGTFSHVISYRYHMYRSTSDERREGRKNVSPNSIVV